jgi:hypothetical protein
VFHDNAGTALSLRFEDDRLFLTWGEQTLIAGCMNYEESSAYLPFGYSSFVQKGNPQEPTKFASFYRWLEDGSLDLLCRYLEYPHREHLVIAPSTQGLNVTVIPNIASPDMDHPYVIEFR